MYANYGQQLYVGASRDFLYLIRLPVPPGGWPDGRKLRACLGLVSHLILCVLANKVGDEMQIVVPRRLPLDDKMEVLNRFMTPALLVDAWTIRRRKNKIRRTHAGRDYRLRESKTSVAGADAATTR